MRLAAAILASLVSTVASAQNNTKFVPDVVMECVETKTNKPAPRCVYQCFSIPRPSNNEISLWTPIVWEFERIEFFSKPGRDSENWLVSVKGRSQSLVNLPISKFFITIGTAFLCTYTGGPASGAEPTEVRLTKYYDAR